MKKHLYLMPVMALSMTAFALSGCDDKTEETAAETPLESSMPVAEVPVETPIDAEETVAPAAVSEETIAAPETPAAAEEEQQAESTITVTEAHAFATAPSATTGAIFARIANSSDTQDFMMQAKTDVSNRTEIHQTSQDPQTGVMQMRRTSGVDIAANGSIELAPDGYHIMLMGLKAPLTAGQTFDVTLYFRGGGEVTVPVTVVMVGEQEMDHDHSDHGAEMSEEAAETLPAEETPVEQPAQ